MKRVGQHQNVESSARRAGPTGVQALPWPALELIGTHGSETTRQRITRAIPLRDDLRFPW